MTSNINQLFSHTGFELAKLDDQFIAMHGYEPDTSIAGDVVKLLAMNAQAPSSEGVALEMQALGFGGEVEAATVGPSVSVVKRDLTDWDNVIS